jgi:hypothetical protein
MVMEGIMLWDSQRRALLVSKQEDEHEQEVEISCPRCRVGNDWCHQLASAGGKWCHQLVSATASTGRLNQWHGMTSASFRLDL